MKQAMEMIRPLLDQLRTEIAKLREFSWKGLHKGVSINFGLGLMAFALITYFIWGFDHIDRLYDSIVLNLAAAVLPVTAFIEAIRQEGSRFRVDWLSLGSAIYLGLAVLFTFSVKVDLDAVVINAAAIMVSIPWLFISAFMVRQKKVLVVGTVPAGLILFLYIFISIFPNSVELNLALLPLIVVAPITAIWTFLVWILFKGVDRWRRRPIWGPGVESIAMLFLAAPSVALAMLVASALPIGDTVVAIIGVFAGLIFSSAVSTPFRKFLRNLGNLSGHPRRRRVSHQRSRRRRY